MGEVFSSSLSVRQSSFLSLFVDCLLWKLLHCRCQTRTASHLSGLHVALSSTLIIVIYYHLLPQLLLLFSDLSAIKNQDFQSLLWVSTTTSSVPKALYLCTQMGVESSYFPFLLGEGTRKWSLQKQTLYQNSHSKTLCAPLVCTCVLNLFSPFGSELSDGHDITEGVSSFLNLTWSADLG